nr:reverse transcriptase domain-containing protein [Tanacetum cinerariifolium]
MPKAEKKGETPRKEKPLAILIVQPWERVARKKITQSFSPNPEIFFSPLGEEKGIKGRIIIDAEIGGHCIHHMYVDGESASEILYEHCFNRLCLEIKNQLAPAITALIGFIGKVIWPIRKIQLLVTIGDKEHSALDWMNFMVVRSPSLYNGIIRRPGVRKSQAVPSTAHGMLKIPVEGGIITIKSSMLVPLECTMVFGPEGSLPVTKSMVEERIKLAINPKHPEQTVMIGSTLIGEGRNSNSEEHDHSWRMCVDFKDLNKAYPKDGYSLSEIDWKVEYLCGFPFKCFLDAYKGYHEIQMTEEDEEKITFITSQRIFCYTKMPFGLRNARANYQRLVDKAFHKQIGKNLEVYVDDLVIKSRTKGETVTNIEETFKTLREINMKLNPKKYTFRIEEGMFLGYKISTMRLKVCPDKLIAKLSMLVAPMEKEELIVYLAETKETVRRIRENITSRRPFLHGVFVPLAEPFTTAALTGTKGTYDTAADTITALSTTFVSASSIPPISTDDYEVMRLDGQEGAGTESQAIADGNGDPFANVDDVDLNVL